MNINVKLQVDLDKKKKNHRRTTSDVMLSKHS